MGNERVGDIGPAGNVDGRAGSDQHDLVAQLPGVSGCSAATLKLYRDIGGCQVADHGAAGYPDRLTPAEVNDDRAPVR